MKKCRNFHQMTWIALCYAALLLSCGKLTCTELTSFCQCYEYGFCLCFRDILIVIFYCLLLLCWDLSTFRSIICKRELNDNKQNFEPFELSILKWNARVRVPAGWPVQFWWNGWKIMYCIRHGCGSGRMPGELGSGFAIAIFKASR